METQRASGPLRGIKVLEWAHVHFGPGAGMFLSDMGAEVIHVEPRDGDSMRVYETLFGANFLLEHGRNTFTEDLLRNKRSLAIDVTKPEAREVLYKLLDETDVFLTNYRPQAGLKLGLDYETLSRRNPRLVYAQGTSYGTSGPQKDAPGLEMMGLAQGGIMLGSAVPHGEPVYPTMGLNDRLGAIGLLITVLSALVDRERTGIGQLCETSLLGWTVNLQASAISYVANVGKDIRPLPRPDQDDPNYNTYRLKDGSWTALGMTYRPEKYWPLLCRSLDLDQLIDDPRFVNAPARRTNARALFNIFVDKFAGLTWSEWEAKIDEYGLIACKVNALTDLNRDEQVLSNEYLVSLPHPDFGTWWYVPTPIRYAKTPISIRSAAPRLGEHNEEILGELGYSPEQISELSAKQVI